MKPYLPILGFDVDEFVDNRDNIALTDGKGSYCLFEFERPGVYSGHYFFKVRGREALTLARELITEMFLSYGAQTIIGLTPPSHKGALWLTRQLEFTFYEEVESLAGPLILSILQKGTYINV